MHERALKWGKLRDLSIAILAKEEMNASILAKQKMQSKRHCIGPLTACANVDKHFQQPCGIWEKFSWFKALLHRRRPLLTSLTSVKSQRGRGITKTLIFLPFAEPKSQSIYMQYNHRDLVARDKEGDSLHQTSVFRFQVEHRAKEILRTSLKQFYSGDRENPDAVTLAWNFVMAEVR